MKFSAYRFDGGDAFRVGKVRADDKQGFESKAEGVKRLAQNREEISRLQTALYAEGRQSLLIILQAMDAAGKDGTIRHVFTGVNPQGVVVTSFKQPSREALSRDYLWRVHAAVPQHGMIGIFNRSHYEDVLAARVLDLPKGQALPERALDGIWDKRYRQIRDFERMLYENGTTILKFHLALSRKEQAERFLARASDPTKNWKFSPGDLNTSGDWDKYMDAYERAINETATPHAPWYVIPADRKWYARAVVSQIIVGALRDMDPRFPRPTKEQLREIDAYKARQAKKD